jgi:hypothetical protein
VFVLGSLQSDKIIEIKTITIMAGCSNFFVYLKITISKLVGFSTGGVSSCRKFSPGSNHPATPNFLSSPLRPKSQPAHARRSEQQAGSFLLSLIIITKLCSTKSSQLLFFPKMKAQVIKIHKHELNNP